MSVLAPDKDHEIIRIPELIDAEAVAREWQALARELASLASGAYDRLDAVDLARIADMANRCRRNAEALRPECGR